MPYRPSPRRRGFTIRDLLVVVVLAGAGAAAVAPAADAARERERRVRCASHLRVIGQAIQMYANENKGNFPRTRFDPAHTDKVATFTNWKAANPFAEDGPEPNDVTAALFLLLRTQDVSSIEMLCPGDRDARLINFGAAQRNAGAGPAEGDPDPVAALDAPAEEAAKAGGPAKNGDAADWPSAPAGPAVAESLEAISNFPDPSNLSYSYINPYPSVAARDAGFKLNYTLTSDFAIAADLNPGGEGPARVKADDMPPANLANSGAPREATWKFDAKMKNANSPNHGGFGQNVLYADGHVDWQPTPFCGMPRDAAKTPDNVYTPHRPNRGNAVVGPVADQLDSILLPTAADRAKDRAAKPAAERRR